MKNKKPRKLLVNAIPLLNIRTGISRYLECLYTHLEMQHGGDFEIYYFTGTSVTCERPRGPANLNLWSSSIDFFWRLPTLASVSLRMVSHLQRELSFRRVAKDYDIYHEAAFFPFRHSASIKKVFTLHDLSLMLFPHFHPKERVIYSKIFLRRNCRSVDHFVTDSEFVREQVIEYFRIDKSKVTAVPLAHDNTVFYPRGVNEIDVVRNCFKLPKDYFLAVGSGDPRKNMEIIPAALHLAHLDTPLVLIGWAGWSASIDQGSVTRSLGYVSDQHLAALYSGALGLIYPSLYEGFGLPVLEAMSCCCPVICSKQASIPEVAGSAALYMDNPHSIQELADLLRYLAGNNTIRETLSKKGKIQAESFSWTKTAEQMAKLFKCL